MGANTDAQTRENQAAAFAARATHALLQTTAANTSFGTEVTGGTPAYARKPLTWAPGAVDGTVTASATFDLPANVAPLSAAYATALTGGTFVDAANIAVTAVNIQSTLVLNFTHNVT